jgi:hypothetical protein
MAALGDPQALSASVSLARKRKASADESPRPDNGSVPVPAPRKPLAAIPTFNWTRASVPATMPLPPVVGQPAVPGVPPVPAIVPGGPTPAIPGLPPPSFLPPSTRLPVPVDTQVLRTFDCQRPVRPVLFPETPEVLPFPVDLRDLVAWTDAFVERLGWMALLAQEVGT